MIKLLSSFWQDLGALLPGHADLVVAFDPWSRDPFISPVDVLRALARPLRRNGTFMLLRRANEDPTQLIYVARLTTIFTEIDSIGHSPSNSIAVAFVGRRSLSQAHSSASTDYFESLGSRKWFGEKIGPHLAPFLGIDSKASRRIRAFFDVPLYSSGGPLGSLLEVETFQSPDNRALVTFYEDGPGRPWTRSFFEQPGVHVVATLKVRDDDAGSYVWDLGDEGRVSWIRSFLSNSANALKLPSYFNVVNTALLEHGIPTSASHILDVGCGMGATIEAWRELHMLAPNGSRREFLMHGVEMDPLAAEVASGRLDEVWRGSIEEVVDSIPDETYDTIILADVLEHLVEPDVVLSALRSKLAQQRQFRAWPHPLIVVSVPNIGNWYESVSPILQGTWRYADNGVSRYAWPSCFFNV